MLSQRFADSLGQALGPDFPTTLGIAVSGGGDSMALLHLTAAWARVYGVTVGVVTVDHGLRDASAAEARMVADECAILGLAHKTLHWTWDGSGNLQNAAREARMTAIGQWAKGRPVLFGHTRDDQAETLLMRLARGSGVDGLAAMQRLRNADGWQIVRPLLDVGRGELRHYLKVLNIPYVDDPSNDDPHYARVRMRHLIGQEGLDIQRLAATADAMARAQVALAARAYDVAQALLRPTTPGCIALDRDGLARIEKETQLRLLAGAIGHVAGVRYRPRLAALERTLDTVLAGGRATIQGAVVVPQRDLLVIGRELQAVTDLITRVGDDVPWDGRWVAKGCDSNDLLIRSLGQAGLAQVPVRPVDAAPTLCLTATPGIWDGDALIACPALGFGLPYRLVDTRSGSFPQSLLVH
ncbi:tRNA lysidine(34) synthetase TilS [Loktanella sp. SALINAS62]|uniref:tRNA lysidine(34) synthetase TilS n=1 Tax=Loktanella sp. SALINAS62 TaxID=2706124 RepID=UPI0020115EA5|nr:tRNA lysidine(34) synthetase TilS [Loktanella sp. SALINAS62]